MTSIKSLQKFLNLSKNSKILRRSLNEEIGGVEEQFNKEIINMIQNKTTTENANLLKHPGTKCEDEKLQSCINKYLEQNTLYETEYKDKFLSTDDPFKVRDADYMAYKYAKNRNFSRNYKNYQTLTDKHKSLSKEALKSSLNANDFDAYNSKPNKIENQFDKYNSEVKMNSRDYRLNAFNNKNSLKTLSNPKAKRYQRNLNWSTKKDLQPQDQLQTQNSANILPLSQDEKEGNTRLKNSESENKDIQDNIQTVDMKNKTLNKFMQKSSIQNPIEVYKNNKQNEKLTTVHPLTMYRSFSKLEQNKDMWMTEINRKLDMNCVDRLKNNHSSLKFIL